MTEPVQTIEKKFPKKKWWRSTTILSGIGTVVTGVVLIATGDVIAGITAIATGAGTIFGRVKAKTVIAKENNSN